MTNGSSNPLDDGQIISCIARGDPACLALLYDKYAGSAHGLAWTICRNATIAEDVVQEAFLSIWQRPGNFDSRRGSLASFLMGIVHHKAIDAIRRESSNRAREERFVADSPGIQEDDAVEAVQLSLRRQYILNALGKLSPLQSEALQLAYMNGLSYREVAERLRIPLGTAKSRMRDAMIKLKTLLTEEAP